MIQYTIWLYSFIQFGKPRRSKNASRDGLREVDMTIYTLDSDNLLLSTHSSSDMKQPASGHRYVDSFINQLTDDN